jgi:alpha-glucoside transport system permease protein
MGQPFAPSISRNTQEEAMKINSSQPMSPSAGQGEQSKSLRLAGLVVALIVTLEVYRRVFLFLRDGVADPWLIFGTSLLWGIGGVWLLFVLVTSIIDLLPMRIGRNIMPWVFALPAISLVFYYLLVPTFRTFWLSLLDDKSIDFVGLTNYAWAFTSKPMLESFTNTLIWIVVGGGMSVILGLFIAALSDRTRPGFEVTVKTTVFLPMAISMVASAVIWRLMYQYRPGTDQIGLLNAVNVAFGGAPIAWMISRPLNTFLLVLILIWMQTGFALVVFSAAIKGLPSELLEAARIDGASEWQSFFKITIPYIQITIISVTTTIVIFSLKVFDIVFGMTGGNFGTQVIANEQYSLAFRDFNNGRGAAVAMVLLLAVLPVVYFNIRDFGKDAKGF